MIDLYNDSAMEITDFQSWKRIFFGSALFQAEQGCPVADYFGFTAPNGEPIVVSTTASLRPAVASHRQPPEIVKTVLSQCDRWDRICPWNKNEV
jgi:hypothetical protein